MMHIDIEYFHQYWWSYVISPGTATTATEPMVMI